MKLSHIVAMSKDRVIGNAGGIPWDLPEDLKAFKKRTMGHTLIMGRKTYDSIGKPLEGRRNIVVSRSLSTDKVEVARSLEEALSLSSNESEVFIIGGGEIYAQTINSIEIIYLTEVHATFSGETRYPKIDMNRFNEVERVDITGSPSFSLITYAAK